MVKINNLLFDISTETIKQFMLLIIKIVCLSYEYNNHFLIIIQDKKKYIILAHNKYLKEIDTFIFMTDEDVIFRESSK